MRGGKRTGAGRPRAPGETFERARTRKEAILADLRQLELNRRRGELVEVSMVTAIVEASARQYRDSWLNFPARLGPELAAKWQVDAAMVCRDLEAAIHQHLTELADWTQTGTF